MQAGQTALQALEALKLDWTVDEATISYAGGDINTHKALVRNDNAALMGVVGVNYQILQNRTLAALADSLSEGDNEVSVDTMGSLAGGQLVFIGLRGENTVIGGDEAYQFLVLKNTHNGSGSVRLHPTMTRVVCANTYAGSDADAALGYAWKHTSGLMLRQDEIVDTLRQWRSRMTLIKREADALAGIDVTAERVSAVMVAVYESTVGYAIPLSPTNGTEQRRLMRATEALAYMQNVFDKERAAGCRPSAWLAAQATTNWVQHVYGTSEGEARAASTVWGQKAEDSARAVAVAAKLLA